MIFSTSLGIKEVQIQFTMRLHYSPISMPKIKKIVHTKSWSGCGTAGSLTRLMEMQNWIITLENSYKFKCILSMLLLLLSHISRVWLCAIPQTAVHQAPVPGILQARTLEWVAISFSSAWKWNVKVKSLSRVWLFETPWTVAYQALPSMGFPRQEYWSGVPYPL